MSKKIFIIEDDANLLSGLQAKFSLAGFEIETNSGNVEIQEIINDIKKFQTSFIVLDLILPQVDGFAIIKAIKEDEEISDSPIFVFSNLSDQDSKSRGLNLGVKHYFVKNDFSIDEFVGKVIKIIENEIRMKAD